VAEAAARLGVTVVTVRRMIKRGELEAERVLRPQGSAYLVTLPPAAAHGTEDGTVTETPTQNVSRTQGTATELMAAWSTAVLAPLVAELAVSRQRIEDLSAQVGELRAENRALEARTAPQSVEPPTGASLLFLRRQWLWVAVLAGFVVLIVTVLAWPG
jgi:excisionase family DNA binding protein